MRVAHFSDIHVARSPLAEPLGLLHPKRALGAVNHYGAGRGRHFEGAEARIAALLADADACRPDHVLCTGDLTMMSYEREFADVAALFGPRLNQPERYTVLPGNHDRYTREALDERRFERYFGRVSASDHLYPLVKRLAPKVSLVAIDVSRPTGLGSSGFCGEPQRRRLETVLTDRSLADDFVILALHYGFYRASGRPDRLSHRLVDYERIVALVDRDDVRVDLVLHGHVHRHYAVRTKRRPVVCAGSATDLAIPCGYNVYDVDPDRRTFATTRRVFDRKTGNYAPSQRTTT